MKRNKLAGGLAALIWILPISMLNAQTMSNTVATNHPDARAFTAPPTGFDPLNASDAELASYGFPPRPDPENAPSQYASWQRAMNASKVRVIPQLEITNIAHGPHRPAPAANERDATGTSYNWSGAVDLSGATRYGKTSFYYNSAEYVIPVARQAFGSCTGSWEYSSSWVGIDGYGSSDVLQAGTESDAYCAGTSTATFYSAWYEWFPYNEVRITNLPVSPGDDMFVEVWSTSSTQGHAYVENLNTNQVVSVTFNAYPGHPLIGNSAEWVVERPGVGGGLTNLTNYVADYFGAAFGGTFSSKVYSPGTAGSLILTMLNNSGQAISQPVLLGSIGILFQDEGTAR
jgi:hypothetical protein